MLGEHATRAHAGTRHISHGEHAPLAYSASRSLSRSLTSALRSSLPSISFPHHFLASFCRAQMLSARTCFYFASSAPSVPRGIPFFFISLSWSRDFYLFLQQSLERFFVAFYVVLFFAHLRPYTRHACFCSDFLSCFLFYLFCYSFPSWFSIHRLLHFLPFTFLFSLPSVRYLIRMHLMYFFFWRFYPWFIFWRVKYIFLADLNLLLGFVVICRECSTAILKGEIACALLPCCYYITARRSCALHTLVHICTECYYKHIA